MSELRRFEGACIAACLPDEKASGEIDSASDESSLRLSVGIAAAVGRLGEEGGSLRGEEALSSVEMCQ